MKALFNLLACFFAAVLVCSCVINHITLANPELLTNIPASKRAQPSPGSLQPQKSLSQPKTISLIAPAPVQSPQVIRPAAPPNVQPPAYDADPKRITLFFDLSTQTGQVIVDGKTAHTFRFSSGKMGYDTPTGTTFISGKNKFGYSRTYQCDMPWAMNLGITDSKGVNLGIFVHEGRVPKNLYPSSHKCIRVSPRDAEKLFGAIPIGAKVIIEGSARSFYEKNFDGYHLLAFDQSGKPWIKRNPDGGLTKEFVEYVNSGKMEVLDHSPTGEKISKENGVLCFEFIEKPWERGVPVKEFRAWQRSFYH